MAVRRPKGHDADQATTKYSPPVMTELLSPELKALYRYPVKGLTPERLERVSVGAGETLPFDRAYAIENGPGRFDPDAPRHLPKINFLMLMRDERLATLRSQFDDATETLTILRDGKQVARGQLTTPHRPSAHRAVHRQLHEGRTARAAQDRARAGPQLLGRGGQVRAHRQPGERARARAHAGPAGRSAALPRQPVHRRRGARGPSSAGSTRTCTWGR